MSEHPLPPQHGQAITGTAPATAVPERAPLGLIAIFGSTFFPRVG